MERDLADALAACRKGDMRRGLTSRGPHRDDMELRVGGMAAREYASQGQQRSVALAMKLAETELIREVTGEYPLLLLDDVLSELDAARSKRVLGVAREAQMQCIVTTTDLTVDEAVFGRGCAFYKMEGGRLAGEGA
jgi:DNA replication and repair protein RecF